MKRNGLIDFIKGGLILLVIVGHTLQYTVYGNERDFWEDPLFKIIYIYHMPLFVLVSGFLFYKKRHDVSLFQITNKVVFLIVPVFSVVFIYTSIKYIYYNDLSIYFGYVKTSFYSLWFLWVLAIITLINWSLVKLYNSSITLAVLYIVFVFTILIHIREYWFFEEVLYLLPFFLSGILIESSYILKPPVDNRCFLLLLSFLLFFVFNLWDESYYVYNSKFEDFDFMVYIFRLISGLLYSYAFYIICFVLYGKSPIWLTGFFSSLGQKTIFIYIASSFIQPKLLYVLPDFNFVISWFVVLFLSILMAIVFYLISIAIYRFKYLRLFIFGK